MLQQCYSSCARTRLGKDSQWLLTMRGDSGSSNESGERRRGLATGWKVARVAPAAAAAGGAAVAASRFCLCLCVRLCVCVLPVSLFVCVVGLWGCSGGRQGGGGGRQGLSVSGCASVCVCCVPLSLCAFM